MGEGANFCSFCGRKAEGAAVPPPPPAQARPLYRPRCHRIIAGVCAGIAEHFGLDRTLVRVMTVLLFLFTGFPLIAYPVAWIMIPGEPRPTPGAQLAGPVHS